MYTGLLAVAVFLLAMTQTQVSAWPQHIHPVGISAAELEALLATGGNDSSLPPSESPASTFDDTNGTSSQPLADTSHLSDADLIDLLTQGIAESDNPDTSVNISGLSPGDSFPVTSELPPLPTGCMCVDVWQCPQFNIEHGKAPEQEDAGQPLSDSEGLVSLVNLRHAAPCPGLMVCCDDPDLSLSPPSPPLHTPRCGTPNPNGVMTNFLGFTDNQAQFGQFPWMAAIRTLNPRADDPMYGYIGGGSLIHPGIVMTAAHKLRDRNPEDLVVRLGEWDFSSTSETIEYQEIPLERVECHPQFSYKHLKYDVALLFLATEAVLGSTVDTICLPEHEHDFNGSTCVSSGWGKSSFGEGGKYQEILKAIDLSAMSHSQCEAALRTTRLGPTFSLDETFVCAGGEGGDLCTGDGGSPLVCPSLDDPSRYVQVGVSAWGIGCGQRGIPGVYASVMAAMPWIRTVLETDIGFDIRNAFL